MPLETGPMTPQQRLAAGPAAYDLETEATKVGAGEQYRSGFVDESEIGSWVQDQEYVSDAEAEIGYDQYADIPEDMSGLPLSAWDGVDSPMAMSKKVSEIRKEMEEQKVQNYGGFNYFLGQLSGFVTSPSQIAGAAVLPARGASVISAARRGAALIAPFEVAHEIAMHETRDLRTLQQSAINVSSAVVLGGLISGAFGRKLADDISTVVRADITEAVNNHGMRSAGAAEVSGIATPEGELFVNPPWFKWGTLGPGRLLASTDNPESARMFSNNWEHGYTAAKTADGHDQVVAMETVANKKIGLMMRTANIAVNDGYKSYVGAVGNIDLMKGAVKNRGQRIKFEEQVHRAMVNEDKLPVGILNDPAQIAAVEDTAKALRSSVYDQTLAVAKEAGLLDAEEFAVRFAKSYAPRRYNKANVAKDGGVPFKQALQKHYEDVSRPQRLLDEAKVASEEANKKIAGKGAKLTAAREGAEKNVARIERTLAKKVKPKAKTEWGVRLKDAQKALKLAIKKESGAEAEAPFSKTLDDFRAVQMEHDEQIRMLDSIDRTYDRIVHSYDHDVFVAGGTTRSGIGSPFRERQVPLDDNFLLDNGWLESSLDAMTMNHINRVLKPSYVTLRNGDPEMSVKFAEMERSFNDDIRALSEAGKTKEAGKLDVRKTKEMEMQRLLRDRFYGRKTLPSTRAGAAVNDIFRGFRNLNTSLLMGLVLPTSAGDVARWNIATLFKPELAEAGPKLVHALKTAKLNRKQHIALAIGHETDTRIRQAKIFDGTEMVDVHGATVPTDLWVKGTGWLSKKLMDWTHLAPYTDWGKFKAAAYVQNDMVHSLRNYAGLSKTNKQHLARFGFNENDARILQEEIARSKLLPEGEKGIDLISMKDVDIPGLATFVDVEQFADKKFAKKFGEILFRESERSIISPTVVDMPMWLGDSEAGKSIAQFMSFAFAAVNQIGVPIGRRTNAIRYGAEAVDLKAYAMTGQLVAGGMLAVVLRNAINGRLPEMEDWTPMDYALNAVDYSGAVPLLMMAFNGVNMMSQNSLVNAIGASTMTRSANKPIMSLLGPTAGTIENAIRTTQNAAELNEWTDAEIRTAKRLVPWYKLQYSQAAERLKEQAQ